MAQQADLPYQQSNERQKAPIKVLVLGTFHFTGAPDFNAIDAPQQQKEVKTLVKKLSEFNPTKIALEFERKDTATVDSLYRVFRQGKHQLTVNERQQIGFRMAVRLNHPKVYPIDYKKPWGMKRTMKWAKKNNPEFVEYVNTWQEKSGRMDSVLHRDKTVSEILAVYNSPQFLNWIQEIRMRTLEVGAGKNYTGVEPVASVYKRNMRIFANLTNIAETGDRILIVYGAGHAYFFNTFIRQHPNMKLVRPGTYLETLH